MSAHPFPTQHVFGLDFVTGVTIDEVAHVLAEAMYDVEDRWRCVITPNVDHLVRYTKHAVEADVARHATVVLPDGMPIVWASKLMGEPLTARLPGSDLFAALWPRISQTAAPCVVVAPNERVADGLLASHRHARCLIAPYFDVDDAPAMSRLLDEIDDLVREHEAVALVVGISMPKHHRIADGLRHRWAGRYLGTPIVMLLGASPELALGLTPRAPQWMQRSGLEWLHRLALDPRRMAKRYLVDDVAFGSMVWREWRRARAARA